MGGESSGQPSSITSQPWLAGGLPPNLSAGLGMPGTSGPLLGGSVSPPPNPYPPAGLGASGTPLLGGAVSPPPNPPADVGMSGMSGSPLFGGQISSPPNPPAGIGMPGMMGSSLLSQLSPPAQQPATFGTPQLQMFLSQNPQLQSLLSRFFNR